MATTEGLRAERLARVNDAIQGSGYNQTEIARAMDVSKAAVSRWMTGASCPTRDKIVALEKLLGLPARSLVNGTTGAPSKSVFVKILQKNWLGVFLSLKNLSRGFAPTLRYPRIFF